MGTEAIRVAIVGSYRAVKSVQFFSRISIVNITSNIWAIQQVGAIFHSVKNTVFAESKTNFVSQTICENLEKFIYLKTFQ